MSTRTMVEMLHQNGDWDEGMIEREALEAKREAEQKTLKKKEEGEWKTA